MPGNLRLAAPRAIAIANRSSCRLGAMRSQLLYLLILGGLITSPGRYPARRCRLLYHLGPDGLTAVRPDWRGAPRVPGARLSERPKGESKIG
jgi:hypothetical protein